jgi:hypothetical protein
MWPRAPRISTNISTCSEDVAFTYRITHPSYAGIVTAKLPDSRLQTAHKKLSTGSF